MLKNLRIEDAPEHPRAVMDRFFVPNEQTGMLTPGEMGRSVLLSTSILP